MGAEYLISPRTRDPRNPGLVYVIIILKRLQFLLLKCVDHFFMACQTCMGEEEGAKTITINEIQNTEKWWESESNTSKYMSLRI